ncbi:MAG TPA: carboxypeptidase-like regulatory domain-containing protein [Candidatus Thermoplasmatota archaeon]
MRSAWAFGVGIAVVFAGCAAGEGAGDSTSPLAAVTDESGALGGRVIDDSINAVANAIIAISSTDISTTSGPDGTFLLGNLPPGTHTIVASLEGFSPAEVEVDIVAGDISQHDFTLIPLPSEEPYHVMQNKKGRTACGMAWRTPVPTVNVPGLGNVTGSGALAACGAAYNTPVSSLDSFVVIFELTSGNISSVNALALETHWTRTQTFGSGLTVLWENYQEITPAYTFTEDVRSFTEVWGPSPLIAIVDQETIWANMTHWDPPPKYCMPNSTCKFWARVFPYTSTFGPGSAADLALYIDQPYDHYATEFYRKDPPQGYTAIADA